MNWFATGVTIGIGATMVMDAWALLLKGIFGVPSLDYALVGRWIGHMGAGRLAHDNIGAAPAVSGERALGWAAHYLIGILFGVILVAIGGEAWTRAPTLPLALAIGVGAIVAPFFVMQPAFGLGVAASRLPHPNVARLKSLLSHLVFGVGLYAAALLCREMFA